MENNYDEAHYIRGRKSPILLFSLGGASGASTLTGHHFTYEGSMHGEIVAALIHSQCINPIIFLNELDKVSKGDNGKGEELINVLVHLTDSVQNSTFCDRYFSSMEFDLSKALLIFSYNDAT